MDIYNLNTYHQILDQVYSQSIKKNEESIKTWTQYRDRHKKVIEGLQTIVNDVSVNCVVPLGKRAFMKGKLTHTNEILVCIGDGYFVKYSSHQAVELCNRRIKRAEKMLEDLEKERNLFETRQMFPLSMGAFESDDCKDINEYWDDKKIEDWRIEHRKKEKEYRQKLIELKNSEKKEIVTEEDLFKRLDELELEEELSDEINRLEGKYDDGSDQDQSSMESEDEPRGNATETEDEQNSKEIESLPMQSNNQTFIESVTETSLKSETIEKPPESMTQVKDNSAISDNQSESLSKSTDHTAVTNKQSENLPKTSADIEINVKQPKSLPKTTVSQIPKVVSPVIIDNKINGKFEVSIISEDEIERTLRPPISRSPSKSTSFIEETNKKFDESPMSDSNIERSKSSSRRVSFAEPHFVEWQPPDEHSEESNQATASDVKSDEDNDEENLIKIEFKHSDKLPSADKGKEGEILSPDDVYHMFSTPKSILKKNFEPYQHVRRVPLIDETSDEEYHIEIDDAVKSTYNLVVKDIKERKVGRGKSADSNEATSTKRPVSRFKLERTNLKNDNNKR
ncbi:unconventional prefoldin RPB5 interactor-like protein [Phymastichus coffea]|uniref:unconventional prefoldin RPB5 interactor-like protein n=1 Tax=Phymastichus coffea TaxID=108790 RepID=UPI00273C4618|nr:unconventional prefoldin RPB5 interactor-like protein [Phymastichus coffea]